MEDFKKDFNKNFNPKIGDMVLYKYLKDSYMKANILTITDNNEYEIEVGVCHRKSQDLWYDKFVVKKKDLRPFDYLKEN